MLDDPGFGDYDLSSLRTGIMAGSPCPVEVMKRVMEVMHMREVSIAYGMTETSPVSTQTAPDDPVEKRVGSVGRVHPWVEVKVIDPGTGETVQRGETAGELCTRGYSVMRGYWEDPERTAEAIDSERWMHTGDLATMDEDGYVGDRRPDQGPRHPRWRERLSRARSRSSSTATRRSPTCR